jgi:hypothetical protein
MEAGGGNTCADGFDRPHKSVTTRPVEYTDLVKRYTQIFVKWSIQIELSGGQKSSGAHSSSKVEYTDLAVEQLWLVESNKLKCRNSELLVYNQLASL